MKDKAKESLDKIESQTVKIDTPFKVTITASLGTAKDGKTVVLKDPKPVASDPPVKNDPVMEKFVQDWILAVGDAGWFGYLTRLEPKPKTVVITVEQNETDLVATVKADQPDENYAKSRSSSLSLFLIGAAEAAKGDDQTFLKQGSVTSEGKNLVLNIRLPMRKLAETKEKESKPSGNAAVKSNENTAEK
jgi:hypothetical protein